MENYEAVCAGHICLDCTPRFVKGQTLDNVFVPGRLSEVGEMVYSLGGSVANTGIALGKLGVSTCLMAKCGEDETASLLKTILKQNTGVHPVLSASLEAQTSYSVVVSLPHTDRIFLHNPGANHMFGVDDIDFDLVSAARLFHFGYPTAMRRMYENDGEELVRLFRDVKALGVTTSLDLSLPHPESAAGRADWKRILERCAPYVDVFLPSIEEIIYMLDRQTYNDIKKAAGKGSVTDDLDIDTIARFGDMLIGMGMRIVVLKCGTLGYYVKTADAQSLAGMGKAAPHDVKAWADQELFSGIYHVEDVKSATGAGDTSIGGFLTALLKGDDIKTAISTACAVGAFCVQTYGATDGIPSYEDVQASITRGWQKSRPPYSGDRFAYDDGNALYTRR